MQARLYSAGEIVGKLRGVSTRQILDLAEKGLITPARETTGAGSPRLYDFQNIFEICVCLAVRGRIPAPAGTATQELVQNVLQFIRDEISRMEKVKFTRAEKLIANAEKKLRQRLIAEIQEGGLLRRKTFEPPPFEVLLIDYDTKDYYRLTGCLYKSKLGDLLTDSKKYRPQNYCTYNIEVLKLWEHLDGIF